MLGSAKANLPSQVYTLLSPQPQPLLFYLLANTKNVKVQNRIKNFLFKFPQILSRLPRAELQSLGVKPGPEFEQILSKIFAMQLDGKIKSHSQLMKEMRELAGIKEPPPPPPPPTHPPKKGKGADASAAHKKGREAAEAASPAHTHKGKEATVEARAGAPSAAAKAVAKTSTAKAATAVTAPPKSAALGTPDRQPSKKPTKR